MSRRRAASFATGAAAVACALASLSTSRMHAEVVTDGSLGGAATTLAGPNFHVAASLGRQVGGNLFHSFARMDVAAGESLTFDGPSSVDRVLARVTNGRPTAIDGTLRCAITGADVYLINRAGVTFGPSAALDVGGSFAVTTADVVRLADGGTFSAGAGSPAAAAADLLTSAPPVAFGFLTPARTGTVALNAPFLVVPPGNAVVIAGGAITASGGFVQAPGGKVQVAAVASTGELSVDVANLQAGLGVSDGATLGLIGLTFFSADVSGSPAGRVDVLAHDLTVSGSNMTADSFGGDAAAAAGALNLRATNALSLASSRVSATTFGAGRGAGIAIDAGSVELSAGSSVFTTTSGVGAGGDVVISAGTFRVTGDSVATTVTADTASSAGAGGGSLDVHAGDASLLGNCFIASRTFSSGRAGDVALTSSGTLRIDQGSAPVCGIFAEAEAGSTGAGGGVRVEAAHLQFDKGSIASSAFGAGPGGAIDVTGGDLQLGGRQELAIISSQTNTAAPAGATRVHANTLRLAAGGQLGNSTFGAGVGGAVNIDATDLSIDGMDTGFFTGLFTQTQSAGAAGPLSVTAQTVQISRGGTFSTITSGTGNAGPVSVAATGALAIEHGERFQTGVISRTTLTSQPAGRGGDITVVTPSLRLINGAITATSDGEGDSGAITVTATDALLQDAAQGAVTRSQISTSATGAVVAGAAGGAGGDVRIDAGTLTILDGGFVTTESFTTRRSGDIHITAGRLALSGAGVAEPERLFDIRLRLPDGSEARVPVANTTEIGTATLLGPAGNITLDVGQLSIESNSYVSASTGGPGKGGDVDIRADDTVRIAAAGSPFLTGVFVASLLPQSGAGGSIRLAARDVQVVEGGIISGETFGAAPGGNVTVAATERVLLSGAGADGPTGVSVQTEGEVGGPGGELRVESQGVIYVVDRAFVTASSFGSGAGGAVTLRARDVTVDRGGFVSSVSRGSGAAGTVGVVADRRVTLRGGGTVSTSAEQTSGGNIQIQAGDRVDMRDSRIAASAGQNGGNLSIDPEFVLLNRSALAANAVNGNGGNMDITAGTFLQSADSTIDVSSRFGLAGTVNITAPDVDVAGALAVLDSSLAGAEARLQELCGRRAAGVAGGRAFSSFVVTARGGVPLAPGGFEPSFVIASGPASREDSTRRK